MNIVGPFINDIVAELNRFFPNDTVVLNKETQIIWVHRGPYSFNQRDMKNIISLEPLDFWIHSKSDVRGNSGFTLTLKFKD
jgi:hypothetical protein